MKQGFLLLLVCCVVALPLQLMAIEERPAAEALGVEVLQLKVPSAFLRAGVQPKDILLSWERPASLLDGLGPARGQIDSIFDWRWLEVNQRPRGGLILHGLRDGIPVRFSVNSESWNADVRPRMSEATLKAYAEGHRLIGSGRIQRGAAVWVRLAESNDGGEFPNLSCWLYLRAGQELSGIQLYPEAADYLSAALELAQSSDSKAIVYDVLADVYMQDSKFDLALQAYRSAMEIWESTWGAELGLAATISRLAEVNWLLDNYDLAERLDKKAVAIRAKLAPDQNLVRSLKDLAKDAVSRGLLGEAEAYYYQALEVVTSSDPWSRAAAELLEAVGDYHLQQNQIREAEELFLRSLEVRKRLSPDSHYVATILNKLGYVALNNTRLEAAEDYYSKALLIFEGGSEENRYVASTLDGLGHVAQARNDLPGAERYFERALAIEERIAPNGYRLGRFLRDLGDVAHSLSQLKKANDYYRRALAVFRRDDPNSPEVIRLIMALGSVAYSQGKLGISERFYKLARSMLEAQDSGGRDLAVVLDALGHVAEGRKQLNRAAENYKRSLAIYENLDAESLESAMLLDDLGGIAYYQGNLDLAEYFIDRSLSILESKDPVSQTMAEALSLLGSISLRRGDVEAAESFYGKAAEIAVTLGLQVVRSGDTIYGVVWHERQRLEALGYGRSTLEIAQGIRRRNLEPDDELIAQSVMALGHGDFDIAETLLGRVLDIQLARKPAGLEVAFTLKTLGEVAVSRGDLRLAEKHWKRALSIIADSSSESLLVTHGYDHLGLVTVDSADLEMQTLLHLGLVSAKRGDLEMAEVYYRRALSISQENDSDGSDVAEGLYALGSLAMRRGELGLAEDFYLKVLEVPSLSSPGNRELTKGLLALSEIAARRGRLEESREYSKRALENCKIVISDPLEMAENFDELGRLAELRSDLESAEEYFTKALQIRQKLIPGGLQIAASLTRLGSVAYRKGASAEAVEYHFQALAMRERIAPGSHLVSESLGFLGLVEESKGALSQSVAYQQRALGVLNEIMPQSIDRALGLHRLSGLLRKIGDLDRAISSSLQALDVMEAHVELLGGTYLVKGDYLKRHMDIYRNSIELLIGADRFSDAFHVLERFKGRSFLSMLAERDLIFSLDVGEEIDRSRRRVAASLNTIYGRLSRLDEATGRQEIDTLSRELRRAQAEHAAIVGEIRRSSPRLASLYYPHSVDLSEAQQILDPGTVLLSYNVSQNRTDLFSVDINGELLVKTLAVGGDELRRRINTLRRLVIRSRSDETSVAIHSLRRSGSELYELLLRPVEEEIEESQRILVIPDGPLHLLPWALLSREQEEGFDGSHPAWQYLAEWRPFYTNISVTVLDQLRERVSTKAPGSTMGSLSFVAFGDPAFAGSSSLASAKINESGMRSPAERGVFGWTRLPNSRREVERISSLFSADTARVYLGSKATEEAVKSMSASADIIHLATHAHLDDRFPMSSGIVLTIPEEPVEDHDNGLLQAWEIFENMRINADLVVLSACSTALGLEQGGEGLIGLTRAFQYAGARSILASLWNVDDVGTSELMVRFYQHLKNGMSKIEALSKAQRELIQGPVWVRDRAGRLEKRDFSAPFYWGAFQVYGDWQGIRLVNEPTPGGR